MQVNRNIAKQQPENGKPEEQLLSEAKPLTNGVNGQVSLTINWFIPFICKYKWLFIHL